MLAARFTIGAIGLTLIWLPWTWSSECVFLSVESMTSEKTYVDLSLFLEFIQRGSYGTSGYIYFNQVILDEDFIIEVNGGYNARHNNNYVVAPYRVPPTTGLQVLNSVYKKYLMHHVAGCSNLPQSEDGWLSYENLGVNYTLNKCVFDVPSCAALFQPGYYKIVARAYRKVPPTVLANATFHFHVQSF